MKDYQKEAMKFRWKTCDNAAYPVFGMIEEFGELLEVCHFTYYGWHGLIAKILVNIFIVLGKVSGRMAKKIRGKKNKDNVIVGNIYPMALNEMSWFRREQAMKELGDIHWMLADLEDQIEVDEDEVLQMNISKLEARKKNNTIASHTDH